MNRRSLSICLLRWIGKRVRRSAQPVQFARFPAEMLCFVLRGGGTLLLDGRLLPMEQGKLYCFGRGQQVEVSLHTAEIEYYALLLEYCPLPFGRNDAAARPRLLQPGIIELPQARPVMERLQQLLVSAGTDEERPLLQLQFQELLYFVVQQVSGAVGKLSAEGRIELAMKYMQTHYAQKIEMSTLASMVNLTASSFSRLFKQTTGEKPLDYLTHQRIEQAKSLLAHDEHRIKAVAAAVGYDDEFYFSRLFHRHVGVSPTFYLKRRRLRVAIASCLQLGDNLRSLGVEPVATVNLSRTPGMDEEEYALIRDSQWNELKQSAPDLIITDRYHLREAERLRRIAPVIELTEQHGWRTHYLHIADMLGRRDEAERTLNELALRIAAAKRQLGHGFGSVCVGVLQISERGVIVHGTGSHPLNELLFQELGMRPGKLAPQFTKGPELQPEWLPPLEAEVMFVCKKHVRAGSERIYERLSRTEAWQAIPAVRNNRIKHIPDWFRLSWTPLGRHAIIDELLKTSWWGAASGSEGGTGPGYKTKPAQ